MEHLEYKIEISAPARTVWETMLQEETYKQWVNVSWPNSFYQGKWAEGEKIKFTSAEGGGTAAQLEVVKPYERIYARHVAILNPDGSEDTKSEIAKGWVGITEEYQFAERNGSTTLTVIIETTPEWRSMFDDGWPGALKELKKLSEKQLHAV
jgi:uncharacterized protein YndB with AHSA1/START domain